MTTGTKNKLLLNQILMTLFLSRCTMCGLWTGVIQNSPDYSVKVYTANRKLALTKRNTMGTT